MFWRRLDLGDVGEHLDDLVESLGAQVAVHHLSSAKALDDEDLVSFHEELARLVDADLASNSASWQWCAGSGADAAPYFRIFNPVTQAQKFDPEAQYIKTYVPELAHFPTKLLHTPWEAKPDIFHNQNGQYPDPIVDLKDSRERALTAYAALPK